MKLLHNSRHGIGALLCVLPMLSTLGVACAADETTAPAPAPAVQPVAMNIILRDANELRTIEVQSDREESVEEFFARQKLSFVEKPNTDGKFWRVGETIRAEPLKFFASYPLDNDREFSLYRYGAFYEMAPTSPTVSALFQNSPTPLNWGNTMLIVAPQSVQTDTAVPVSACIVGRVFIKNTEWRISDEAQKLKYQGAEVASATANN